jgi:hypothetical protein
VAAIPELLEKFAGVHHESHQTRPHRIPHPGTRRRLCSNPNPDINQRKENQQDRIAQGVKSGQLTAGETSRLEHQEAGLNKEERGMRAQDNGHPTKSDRKTLHQQQNQESRRIYRDKHNGQEARLSFNV